MSLTTPAVRDDSETAFQAWKSFAEKLIPIASAAGVRTDETAWYVNRQVFGVGFAAQEIHRLACLLVAELLTVDDPQALILVAERDALPRIV